MAQVSYGTITITDTNDINRIYVEYCRSTSNQLSGTTVPGIIVNWSESTPAWVDGQYIWQRTVVEKSGTLAKTYGTPVCLTGAQGETGDQGPQGPQGGTGAAGRSLTSTATQYTIAATSATITQSNMGNYTWSNNVPDYNASTPAYWVRITNTYSNPSSTQYIIYKDNGITDAVKTSHDANTTAAAANSTANTANQTANTANSTANSANTKADQAVTNVNNLQNKLKYYWVNEVAHTNGVSGWTKPNYPAGTYAASGISGTTFDAENSSTYGYNTWYANGINLRYNAIKLGELTGSALTFYQPSTTNQGAKAMELSGSALKFYASNGTTVQAEFGGSKARVSGTINAYDGQIGNSEDNYWYIGNYLDYFENQSAIIKSHGTASIQLGDSNTWRIATNRIHTAWNNDSSSGDAFKLHFPVYDNKYWDSGLHLPTSANDKLLYIRNSSSSNTLTYLNEALEDQYTNRWNYLFYITNSGSIYAKNIYVLDDNGQATQIGGTDGVYLLKSGGTITGNLEVNGTLTKGSKNVAYLTATPTNGQILIVDGTSGGIKTSGYTIAKSVPSNALFTDENVKSTEANTTKLWLVGSDTSGTRTGTLKYDNGVYITTTAGTLHATTFEGALSGTASRATADGDGNTIKTTYLKLTGGNVTGTVTFGSSVSADELMVGDLVVNGNASFTNNLQANTINGVAVGSSPKFTDVNVTQTATTTSAAYEVLFSYTADNTTRTEGARKTSTFTYNPSTKELTVGTVKIKEASTGFTISGGTTSKTLTVGGDYTLAAAAAKGVVTSIDTSANLPTSNAVKTFVEGKGYITANHTSTYSLPLAASGTRGGVQIGYTQSGKNYPVQLSSEKMYVNVPWENTWTAMTGATSSADGTVGYIGTTPPKSGYNTKYWRADGTWSIPPNDNTHRPIQLDSTEILGNNTTVLNLVTGSGITLSNSSGTVTIAHKDTSSQSSSSNSGRTYIQSITLDTYGHVTGLSTATETVTNSHYTTHLYVGLSDSTGNAATNANQDTYLKLFDNTTVRESHKLLGGNGLTVTSDANGHITFNSPSAFTAVEAVNTGTEESPKYVLRFTKSGGGTTDVSTENIAVVQSEGANKLVSTSSPNGINVTGPVKFVNGIPVQMTSANGDTIAWGLITGAPSTYTPSSHTHGNLSNDGKVTTTATIASGDKLVIVDTDSTAGSKITGSSITFGTSTTTFLSNKGTWETPSAAGSATNATYATYDASEASNTTKVAIADKYIPKSIGTAAGDIIYWSASGTPTRLAKGSNGQVLKLANGVPTWGTDNNDNTWRAIQVNGTDILGTGTSTGKLNLKAGSNVTITNDSGTVTIASSYTNTDTKVTQAYSTTNNSYPLLMTATAGVSSTSSRGDTTAILNNAIYANPSTGMITTFGLTAKKVNNFITGSGTAASDKGSGVSPRYFPAKWTFNIGSTLTDGDIITIKIPVAGHSYGVYLSIDNGTTYKPIVLNGTGRLTTHYGVNTYITLVYESTGSAASIYAVDGGDATTTITGGAWRVINYYDSNTNTIPQAQCETAAGTAAKAASMTNYTATANRYVMVNVRYANTSQTALTLNINSTGAKPIYINGSASSTSNYTLPAGSYLVFYNGTNYYFRTDNIITGNITGNAATATKLASAQTVYVALGTASTTTTIQGGSSSAQTIGVNGTLAIGNGGTGLTASPSMLTNLGSTTAANVLQASPRPGVTGTLGIGNGGTGATTAANAINALLGGLSTWTANPTDTTYFIRQDTGGAASYGKATFSTLWNYISGKISSSGTYVTIATDQTITASQKTFNGATRWSITNSTTGSKYGACNYDATLDALVFSFGTI